jgi:hypothetical protein
MDQRENNTKKQPESPNIQRVRKVGGKKINNDWEYLNEGEFDPYESTDKAFSRSYQYKGLRARTEESENLEKEKKEEEEINQQIQEQNYRAQIERRQSVIENDLNKRIVRENKKSIGKTLEESQFIQKGFGAANKRKTMVVTRSIIWWGSYVWLFVQVPFAVFGIIAFAVIGGISELGESANSNIFTKAVAAVAKTVIDGLTSLLGFNIGDVMEALFFITQFVVISVGILTILIIFIQHILALNRPLGGNGAGLKVGALLIACIGYAVPILNIFPWVLVWVLAIGKYPR